MMNGSPKRQVIQLPIVYDDKTGRLTEMLTVDELGPNQYRLVASPAFVLGLAAGDVFRVSSSSKSGFQLIQRSGNICIQVFVSNDQIQDAKLELQHTLTAVGGHMDSEFKFRSDTLLVFTIPLPKEFLLVENILIQFQSRFSKSVLLYGNVYDPEDGKTPLNWWLDFHGASNGVLCPKCN